MCPKLILKYVHALEGFPYPNLDILDGIMVDFHHIKVGVG
jgi:hypothetical protein